jgi:hypothetical protein
MTVLAIDYDGIIVTDGNWPEPGQVIPEAVESINRLHDSGFCIIINSCRIGKAERLNWWERAAEDYVGAKANASVGED